MTPEDGYMREQDGSQTAAVNSSSEMPTTRRRLVQQAIEDWKRQLIDLGGRNNLLYFRDLTAGTLDLSAVIATEALERLVAGKAVRLSELFTVPESRNDAAKRARNLRAKAVENDQERGIQTLRIARGLATWTSDRSSATPNAPILLYGLEMRPAGVAADDFELQITAEPEVNPSLLHLLSTDFDIHIDGDTLLNGDAAAASVDVARVTARLKDMCSSIPDFSIVDRAVVGNFSYAKLPMVRDLELSEDYLEEHDLLAAIAGDADARQSLRDRQTAAEADGIVAVPLPTDEYLVLDADSSQSYAIAAAVAGANLVVIGPPGTGKSQTIANLIATLIARGKSVLFVAEKRAAIEAVVSRLQKRGLEDLLLDLHDGASNRRRIAEKLNRALIATGETLAPDITRLHQQLERRRSQLEEYTEQVHQQAHPWGLSPFDAQVRLLGIDPEAHSEQRLRGSVLEALTPDVAAKAGDDVERFVELGGAAFLRLEGAWASTYAARRSIDAAGVARIQQALEALRRDHLPGLRRTFTQTAAEAGLRTPNTLAGSRDFVQLLDDLDEVCRLLTPAVFTLDLPMVMRQLAPAQLFGPFRLVVTMFDGEFRQARRTLRECAGRDDLPDSELHRLTTLAADVAARWSAISETTNPPVPIALRSELASSCNDTLQALVSLVDAARVPASNDTPIADLTQLLDDLDRERSMLARTPELHRLEDQLRELHIDVVLDEVVARRLSPRLAAEVVEHVWLVSILDHMNIERPALATFGSVSQDSAVRDFALADRAHIEIASDRVRRAWAERVVRVRNEFGTEASLVAKQASLLKRHMPLRDLFDQAEHVLTAVKPCWVMSPLVVAQVLPARPCFDVVVFDEASQIAPSDAACSLLRGRQAIVAGDPHQLPPTSFFNSNTNDADEPPDEISEDDDALAGGRAASLTKDIESILDVMRSLIPGGQRVLNWHYRSKDERLITFSNAQEALYDWSLTTFPGALAGDCLRHVLVPFRAGAARVTASVPDEVQRVVELVIEHAELHPGESLGIIALGSTHADQISEALRLATSEHPELADLLDEEQDEPLFIKNLERVQGDERDAVILTIGYSKTIDGRMRYTFGPVNQTGGHRRLNVAITRARRRMTVVSSFSGREMDPERVHSVGAAMLRDYLLYAESGGANLGLRALPKPALNAFERDVQEQLSAQGMKLTPQFGVSGYWIDFAVMHPARPSEPILAIEADGASYHSSPSARDRDRLRQEHLERLGWKFHRIWSTDWFRSREDEIERAVAAHRRAIDEIDHQGGMATEPPLNVSELPNWLPTAAVSPSSLKRNGPAPVRPGRSIMEYTSRQVRQTVQWVKSDGLLYTDEELLTETMKALGFRRRGPRIVNAINQAIAAERAPRG